MRRPTWLSADDTYWGLPAVGRLDELRIAADDLAAAARRLMLGELDRRRLRRRVVSSSRPVQLSLGAGPSVPKGWLGVDLKTRSSEIYFADLRRPLPLPSCTVDAVLAEHVLEHLFLDDVARLLHECARVLRPGGAIRVVSPNAEFLARVLLEPHRPDVREQLAYDRDLHRPPRVPDARWRLANRLSHQWGSHLALLTPGLVTELLEEAGFTPVWRCAVGETVLFERPPGTHLERFPGPQHEAFAVEAQRATVRSGTGGGLHADIAEIGAARPAPLAGGSC